MAALGAVRAPALIAALFLLSACGLDERRAAIRRADTAAFAQTELVGLTKADILACAGRPDRIVRGDDTESLVYVSGDPASAKPGASGEKPCDVTFVVRRGFVDKVEYSVPGAGGFDNGGQCAYVVQRCVQTH